MNQVNLERQIKKNIYGKAQKAKLFYPPGFAETACNEVKLILANLWYPQNTKNIVEIYPKYIELSETHISVLTEILFRSKCLSDIQLIIEEEKCKGKEEFNKICRNIKWSYYLTHNLILKLKVNSTASKAFHETGLKEIVNGILTPFVQNIVTGENSNEDACIHFELYKDKLTISISIAGQPLYKRGYKEELKTLAPLREDLAACCIQKYFNDLKKKHISILPDKVYVPFAGSGTFAFELHAYFQNICNHEYQKTFALNKLPLFKKENYNFLVKKADEEKARTKNLPTPEVLCVDTANSATVSIKKTCEKYSQLPVNLTISPLNLIIQNHDFFKNTDLGSDFNFLFVPINPPYGLRLKNKQETADFYRKIALKLNLLKSDHANRKCHIGGFILCPNEESWSIFYQTLNFNLKETYHFTQGGLDIRVCQFFT